MFDFKSASKTGLLCALVFMVGSAIAFVKAQPMGVGHPQMRYGHHPIEQVSTGQGRLYAAIFFVFGLGLGAASCYRPKD